ncbi:aldo/keto reductase [Candidatus Pelagibacter ubique]|nr:aldo/keto reductase [Candidatus Pelagibacter ubique]
MKIILGTAQLGTRYGISNVNNGIKKNDLIKILTLAKKKKIFEIDTALSYKNSLKTLSKYNINRFKLNVKILIGDKKNFFVNFLTNIKKSLKLLKTKEIYSLMIHDAVNLNKLNDLNKNIVIDYIKKLKKDRIIKKVGISIYNKDELAHIINYDFFDIIQLPCNIFDQTFSYDELKSLKNKNIEIHVRSIFLQGLIFLKLNEVNELLGEKPKQIRTFFKLFPQKKERIYNCINFIKNQKFIDKIVLGFSTFSEFSEIIKIYQKKTIIKNYKKFRIRKKKIIKPYLWNLN